MNKTLARVLSIALTLAVAFTSINFPVYAAELENETQVQEIENEPSETEEVSEDAADTETEETVPEENAGEQETTPDAEQNAGEEAQTEEIEEQPEEEQEELVSEEEEEQDLLAAVSSDYLIISGTTVRGFLDGKEQSEVVIPEGITEISSSAFSGETIITSLQLPSTLTTIGASAFSGCNGITEITIPAKVTSIGYRAFSCSQNGPETTLVVKSKSITGSTNIFTGRILKSVALPDGMTEVPELFYQAQFTTDYVLEIPASVTSIGQHAFAETSGLKSVKFNGEKVRTINDNAFVASEIETITLPSSLIDIGDSAFYKCNNLTTITIPSKVTSIGYKAFACDTVKPETTLVVESKSLTGSSETFEGRILVSVKLPDGMTTLPKLFNEASFTSDYVLDIPASVREIANYAFAKSTGLKSVNFKGDKLTTIGDDSFASSEIETITLPNSLTTIGTEAFKDCVNLVDITIPSKVTSVGYRAFACFITKPETTLVVESKSLTGSSGIFEGRILVSVKLPDGMTTLPKLFERASFTSDYILDIPASITEIADYAFKYSTGLKSVNFKGQNLKVIGYDAFASSELEEITFPQSLTTIGYQAFADCKYLTDIVIPDKVTEIGYRAFYCASGNPSTSLVVNSKSINCNTCIFEGRILTSVQLPEGMSILPKLFYSASFDTDFVLEIPSTVTKIDSSAFRHSSGLVSVKFLGNKIKTICDCAFYNSSIETINVPSTVTSIEYEAFYDCQSLSKVYLGPNVTLGYNAFGKCPNAYFYVTIGSKTYKNLINSGIDKDRIITAYSIAYKLNNGEESGQYPSSYDKTTPEITLTDPTREDYKFVGWYFDAKFTKPAGEHVGDTTTIDVSSMNSNITLHAKWDGPYYTVTFDAGAYGELSGENTLEVKSGSTYGTLPTVSVKNEYANQKELLDGWYTEEGELITAETKVTAEAKNQTLYAKYQTVKNSIAAPTVGIWGADEAEDLGTLEATVGDKVYIRCAEDGASLTYSLGYSNANTVEQASYTDETTDAEYTGTFKLAKTGFYKVTAVATFGAKTQTTEVVIHVTEEKADSDLYDAKNANAFWVTYGDEIYDASAIEVPFTGANVALSGYEVYYGKKLLKEGTDYKVSYRNNKAAAAYDAAKAPTIIFTAKGNYTGTIEKSFSIVKNENAVTLAAKNVTVTLEDKAWTFDGQAKEPAVEKVVYKDPKTKEETVISDKDYTVTYANNTNASKKAQVIVTFKGINFCGVVTKTFTINQLDINDASVKVIIDTDVMSAQYNVKNKTISVIKAIQVKSGNETIYTLKASDYKASVKRTTNSDGTRTEEYTLKGVGNFKGTRTLEPYDLVKQDFSNVRVLPCVAKQKANFMDETTNSVVAPVWANKTKNYLPTAYTVVDKYGDVLTLNKDFTVSYKVSNGGGTDFVDANDKTKYAKDSVVRMSISPKNNSIYEGESIVVKYKLEGSYDLTALDNLSVTVNDVVYADKANNFNSKIVVVDTRTNTTLKQKTHYTVSYKYTEETKVAGKKNKKSFTNVRDAGEEVKSTDIVPAGTVLTAVITGVGNYDSGEATIEKNFTVGYNINSAKVTVANVTFGENGAAVKPAESDIKVTLKNETVNSSNYDITNFANNTKAGKASFTLVGKGKYVGTKKVTYKIAAKSAKYNVTYDKGLGSLPKNNKSMASSQTAVNGALSANGYVAPAGYEFAGWEYTPQSKLPETADESASMRASLDLPADKPKTKVIFAVDTENYPVGTDVTLYAWYQLKTK